MERELDDLEAEVAACLGLSAVEMRVAPAGGAGHVAYEVRDPAGSDDPVAFYRCESGFAGRRYGLRREAEVLPVAAALGWPVPQVLGTPGDPPGLLMNLVPGTSRPDPDETEATAPEYLALVAGVHAADPASFPIEQFATMRDALRDELAWWTAYADECGALEEPLLQLAARVLAATLPATDEPPSLVHGDVGAGNFMVEHGRVTAMIDWELAHVGDPHEDMAWLWMRGAHTSFGDPDQRVAEYEAAAGRSIDPERLRWHLALVMWKSCVGMYADLRRPPTPAALVQSMVILTYDALLGAQLLRLLGSSLHLLEQTPVRRVTPATQPAERMLATTELSKESSIIVGYLRECSAQEEWQRAQFDDDLRSRGLPARADLVAGIARGARRAARRRDRARPRRRSRGDDLAQRGAPHRARTAHSSGNDDRTDAGPIEERDAMSYLDEWGLTAADDMFHPRTDDRWWTETWWNAWFVPERKMIGYFYPVFRHNIGVQFGGVVVYDDRGDVEWEVPVFDFDWHQEIPEGLDLRDAELANGMTIKCLEPARRYELGYTSRDLELHLDVEGVIKPLVTNGTPPFNKGHIDQICRITGEMKLEGDTIPIDCLAMRDRSWGPRQDGRQPTVGYNYAAADAENAFLAVSQCKATDVWNITTGFLMREGEWAEVHEGRRFVERDDEGHPVTIRIEATDELGRAFEAEGTAVNNNVFKTYPSMLCWNSLMDWRCDGWQGWGEDQDCWLPRRWRDHRAALQA